MKRYLKLMMAAAAALLAAACGPKTPDPVAEALKSEILGNMPEKFTEVSLLKYELVDSTTFRQEFEMRRKLFEARRDADAKLILKYSSEGKRQNAGLKTESYKKDLVILNSLDSLEQSLSSILDDVAYYEYVFSADAKGPETDMQFREAYAAITPQHQVVGMTGKQKDLHKGLGRVIPGYLEIVKGGEEEE